jgi:hypothetical protein
MSDFVLRHIVRDVLRNSTLADPGDIATEVLRRIPARQTRDALEQALRLYVRQVISEQRTASQPTPLPTRKNGKSWKVTGVRDGWQKRLRDRVHIGASQWKFLADCSYEDLLAAAAERRQLAERNQAWARTYDAWARMLVEHDVQRFGDLPAEALMAALGRAA